MIISVVSQKGGVGKSALARTIAAAYDKHGWSVLLADLDHTQSTSQRWAEKRRSESKGKRSVKLETRTFRQAKQAIDCEDDFDIVILDGAPHATRGTVEAARASTLVLIPTGSSVDDLHPTVSLVKELSDEIDTKNLFCVLMKTTSDHQKDEAVSTLADMGIQVIKGSIPNRPGYIEALDVGRSLTETSYQTINLAARQVVQAIGEEVKKRMPA
jgi:chromosome partitioning protein